MATFVAFAAGNEVQLKYYGSKRLQNIGEIPASDKQSLENLLGQPIAPGERVYIVSFDPSEPTQQQREQAVAEIESVLDAAKQHADEQGVTDEDIDIAVDEAMQHIRPRSDANRS